MKIMSQILCLCSVLFLTSCKDYIIPSTWNYRITVEIETPEGIKTGSAVRQVRASLGWRLMPEVHPISYQVIGEAVVIDLGERGVMFALINWDSYEEVFKALPFKTSDYSKRLKHYRNLKSGTKAKLQNYELKMVTFIDIDDPKSVKLVRGFKFNVKTQKHDLVNDFEEIFGQGVKLKNITIEIVGDPVTWGIVDKNLPKKFQEDIRENWRQLPIEDRRRMGKLTKFKQGE